MSVDPIEYILKDPDRRAKLYLLAVGALIMSTIFIIIGMFILIAYFLKII
jgi:hypothetical protein